jgi:hypothetical protein
MGFGAGYAGPAASAGTTTISGSVGIAGTALVTGSVALTEPITGTVALGSTLFQKLEDSVAATGDVGVPIWEVRRDSPTSSASADGDYATKNQDGDGFSYVRSKAFDPSTVIDRSFEVAPLWSRNVATPIAIIAAAFNLTAAWQDIGPEIPLQGYTKLSLWVDLTIHDSQGVRFKLLAKHTSAGTDEYLVPISSVDTTSAVFNTVVQGEYVEFGVNADQKMLLTWELDNTIPYVQLQVIANVAGTAPGHINTAYVTYGFGG